eukprot:gene17449-22254_t
MPEINRFEAEGLKICMLHIGGYPDRYSPQFKKELQLEKPDVMIC